MDEKLVKKIKAATDTIHNAAGQIPTQMCASYDKFIEMGIDPTLDGEDLGGGLWRVSINNG